MMYIALLRGINVGGHTIKMERICELFSDLKFKNVRTYIQTGNVFFETDERDEQKLQVRIEAHLAKKLGFHVATCLRTIEEMEKIMELDPFKGRSLMEGERFAITFFAKPLKENLTLPFFTNDKAYEVVMQTKEELFIVWHLINGRPGNSYGAFEKKFGVDATTRFWHTTAKILAAAKKD